MFGIFTNVAEAALDVADDLTSGEVPSKRRIAELVDAGASVAVIATMFGAGEDVIMSMLDDDL